MGSEGAVAEALQRHGFPPGLLPLRRVEAHRLGAEGEFEVRLSESVQKTIHGNHVRYAESITGKIGDGRITRLRGISVKELFLWLPVDTIVLPDWQAGDILFYVGPLSEGIPAAAFQ